MYTLPLIKNAPHGIFFFFKPYRCISKEDFKLLQELYPLNIEFNHKLNWSNDLKKFKMAASDKYKSYKLYEIQNIYV